MSLWVSSINSGSNGNCYYIGNRDEAVLIDAGVSCRQTEKRMKRAGLSMKTVKAIFITHEHTDHIGGVAMLSKKYELPVYISRQTLYQSGLKLDTKFTVPFKNYEPVRIGKLCIVGFPKFHDAADPCSILISNDQVKVGVFTDLGKACRHVIHHFKQCHAAFLESNYDEAMLETGRYSEALKSRIRGDWGHLSNMQALELFLTHRPAYMSHLFLSHLSKENNRQEIVEELFSKVAGDTEIVIATRKKETSVYKIRPEAENARINQLRGEQLTLF